MAEERRWRLVEKELRKYSPVNSSRSPAYVRSHVISLMPVPLRHIQTTVKSETANRSFSPETHTSITERSSPVPWERRRSVNSKGSISAKRLDAKQVHLERQVANLRRDMSEIRVNMRVNTPRQYQDMVNYLNFLPQTPGKRPGFRSVTRFIRRCKEIHGTDFIDKKTAEMCRKQKCEVSEVMSKRLWRPKQWRHTGRVISPKLENQLLCYWH